MSNTVKNALLALAMGIGLTAGGCSTVSDQLDKVNPFDKSEAQKKKEQGDVAGDTDRISILELDETLSVTGTISTDQIVLPDAYINTDWPQMGGNSTHAAQRTAADGSLEKVWSRDIGKGSARKSRVVASPIVAGDNIYVMDGNGGVRSYNAQSGERNWEYKVKVQEKRKTRRGRTGIIDTIRDPLSITDGSGKDKEGVGGGIAFASGKIFVSSGLGLMVALDAETGTEVWRKRTRTPLHSAPTVSNGRAFAVSDDNELFAFNANTGEVIWTYQGIIESARMLTAPAPAVLEDVVIAPFSSGELVALRVQNGGVLWQDSLFSSGRLTPLASLNDIASGPVIVDGYVLATAQSGVISAFDLRTGQRIWTQPAGSLGFPIVAGDFVYTVTTNGEVACISKLDGSVVWIQKLQAYKNEKKRKKRIAWAGPVFAGDRLIVVSSRGKGLAIDPYSGAIMSEFKVGGDVFVSPIIANETLYVLTDKAKLLALR